MGKHIIYSKKTQKLPHISFFWPQIVCLTKYALLKLVCKKSKSLSRTNLRNFVPNVFGQTGSKWGAVCLLFSTTLCTSLAKTNTSLSVQTALNKHPVWMKGCWFVLALELQYFNTFQSFIRPQTPQCTKVFWRQMWGHLSSQRSARTKSSEEGSDPKLTDKICKTGAVYQKNLLLQRITVFC